MGQLEDFVKELENPANVISNNFANKVMLISSLKELNNVIGMNKIKTQIIKTNKNLY